jgi:hypothetical protein
MIRRQWPHWLALARVTPFFTRKSRAELERAHNALISHEYWLPSGIFDSHRPLHSRQPRDIYGYVIGIKTLLS